jgi:hypothetical protein
VQYSACFKRFQRNTAKQGLNGFSRLAVASAIMNTALRRRGA